MIYGGAWTVDSCRKLIRLCDLASTFHLPLVHLVDCPGFLIGKESEESGTIRFGSQALAALGQATVPFCSVIIRKAFGVAGAANTKPGSHHFRYAWPSGDWGSLPIEGGIEVAYKAEILESPDPQEKLERIKSRLNNLRSPFRSAEFFEIENIIDPRDTERTCVVGPILLIRHLKPGCSSFFVPPIKKNKNEDSSQNWFRVCNRIDHQSDSSNDVRMHCRKPDQNHQHCASASRLGPSV